MCEWNNCFYCNNELTEEDKKISKIGICESCFEKKGLPSKAVFYEDELKKTERIESCHVCGYNPKAKRKNNLLITESQRELTRIFAVGFTFLACSPECEHTGLANQESLKKAMKQNITIL